MLKRILALAVLGGLAALPACTSNQAAVEPHFTPVNTSTSELQFQVGTATYGANQFLNTVVTFRQPNGLSALLADTPSISLPFTNTAPPLRSRSTIRASRRSPARPRRSTALRAPTTRTFAQTVGAFAYGFLASNSITTGANNSVFYPTTNRQPYYGAPAGFAQRAFYVGPGNQYRAELQGRLARLCRVRRIGGLVPGLSVRVHHLRDPPDDGNLRALGGSAAEQHADSDVHCHDDAGVSSGAALPPQARADVRLRRRGRRYDYGHHPARRDGDRGVHPRSDGPPARCWRTTRSSRTARALHTLTLADNLGIVSGGVAAPVDRAGRRRQPDGGVVRLSCDGGGPGRVRSAAGAGDQQRWAPRARSPERARPARARPTSRSPPRSPPPNSRNG